MGIFNDYFSDGHKPAQSFNPSILLKDADTATAAAQANAEKRARREQLMKQLENLKAQKAQLEAKHDELKKARAGLTDDEIVRMAKVKGIKDSDIKSYINGRITQRNADISSANNANIATANKVENDKLKAQELESVETTLLDLEQKITDNGIKLSTGNKGEKASALATSRTLNNQYEKALAKYKELTKKDWESNVDTVEEATASEPQKAEEPKAEEPAGKPALYSKMTAQERAAYDANGADEDKKAAIVAGVQARLDKKAKDDDAVRVRRNEIKNQAKGNISEAKKNALVTAYRNTYPEGKKPSRTEISKILFGENK